METCLDLGGDWYQGMQINHPQNRKLNENCSNKEDVCENHLADFQDSCHSFMWVHSIEATYPMWAPLLDTHHPQLVFSITTGYFPKAGLP